MWNEDFRPFTRPAPTAKPNAVTKDSIDLYGITYGLAEIDDFELAIFNSQFELLLGAPGSVERAVQIERADVYMMGMRAVKHALNNRMFRGLQPNDAELGWGTIRPQFTCRAGALTYRTNWKEAGVVAGAWTDFIYSAANTGYQLGKEFGIVVSHIVSQVSPNPLVSEIHNQIGRRNLIPTDVRMITIGDNVSQVALYPIPSMIILPNDEWWMEILSDDGGAVEFMPCGIVCGLGRVLKETTPTWVA